MSTELMLLVLLGALLHALWNASIRAAADKFAQMLALTLGSALCAAPVLFVLPAPDSASWPYLAASVGVHFLYFALVARIYEQSGLSVSYPLMRGSAPLLTAVVAVTALGQTLGSLSWLALLLLSGGVLLLSREGKGVGIALSNAVLIAAYTLIDGTGARLAGNGWSYALWMFLFNALPFLAWALASPRRRKHLPSLMHDWRGLLGGAMALASYSIAIWAMTQAPIPLVAALRETAVVFGVVIAALVLKERFGFRRWLAAGMVVAGAIALRLA